MFHFFFLYLYQEKGTTDIKKRLKKVKKYLVSSKKTIIFVLKVGETNKVKNKLLNTIKL